MSTNTAAKNIESLEPGDVEKAQGKPEKEPSIESVPTEDESDELDPQEVDDDDKRKESSEQQSESNEEDEDDDSKSRPWWRSTKFLVGMVFGTLLVLVIADTATSGHVKGAAEDFLDWVEENAVAGLFLFVLVYFVATVFFIPGSVLTLGAGFVFSMAFGLGTGVVLGSLSVFLGASLGAIASFLMARYLLRDQAKCLSRRYTVFQALDQALAVNGLKIFCLLRLSPIVPFNCINYIGGVSSVSLRDYVLALVAIMPGTVLYVFLGASAGSLADSMMESDDNPTLTIVIVAIGAVFGILAIYMTTRYAKRELNRILEDREQHQEGGDDGADDNDSDEEAAAAQVPTQSERRCPFFSPSEEVC